jgi:hypothetical protein
MDVARRALPPRQERFGRLFSIPKIAILFFEKNQVPGLIDAGIAARM